MAVGDEADRELHGRARATSDHEATQALAAIIRSSPDAVVAKTVDGTITSWNAGAAQVYGHAAADVLGRSFEVLVPPEALAEERARHERVATGVAESGFHAVRLTSDGRRVELVMSMSPVLADDGSVSGVASIARPISANERDLARFASLLEAAPDGIVCVDAEGTIVTVNAQLTEMFGFTREDLVGARVEMLLPEDVRSRHVGLRSSFLRAPQVRTMGTGLPLRGRRKDGSVFPIEVSLAPDRAQSETIVIAAVRDMTQQRLLEREAVENQTRLRQLAENVDAVTMLRQIDPPAVLYVSPNAVTILGRDPAEWVAADDVQVVTVHPDDLARVQRDFAPDLSAGRAAAAEFRAVLPDGGVRWVRAVVTPVANPNGAPERTVITIQNIDERVRASEALRRAEAEAVRANRAKNHFLSRMSHELRTPLNAVLGFGQLLEMRLTEPDDVEAVDQILAGGRHLLELIDEVLDITRIEAGETSTTIETIPVADVLAEVLPLMRPLADAGGVRLRDPEGPDGPAGVHVRADRQRLRQILLNLLSNAVKYNRTGGGVWVEHRVSGERVAIAVRDDGPGVAPELQDRLFTPFDRLGAEAGGVEGSGIGLALSRSLAELMHGTLSAESQPGVGSTFTVTLPRAETPTDHDDLRPAAGAGGATDDPAAVRRTLLYVEDNEPNVRVMQHLVKVRPSWRLVHAGLGGSGVTLARSLDPDLVVLDLNLPDLPGAEVLRQLKDDPATAHLPVVVLTADAAPGLAGRLRQAGAAHVMTKPLDVREMLSLLDDAALPPAS